MRADAREEEARGLGRRERAARGALEFSCWAAASFFLAALAGPRLRWTFFLGGMGENIPAEKRVVLKTPANFVPQNLVTEQELTPYAGRAFM